MAGGTCWPLRGGLRPAHLGIACMSDSLKPHRLYVVCQAPPSVGSSRQENWSGLPFPTSGDLSGPGIEPESLVSPALAGGFFVEGYLLFHADLGPSCKSRVPGCCHQGCHNRLQGMPHVKADFNVK